MIQFSKHAESRFFERKIPDTDLKRFSAYVKRHLCELVFDIYIRPDRKFVKKVNNTSFVCIYNEVKHSIIVKTVF